MLDPRAAVCSGIAATLVLQTALPAGSRRCGDAASLSTVRGQHAYN